MVMSDDLRAKVYDPRGHEILSGTGWDLWGNARDGLSAYLSQGYIKPVSMTSIESTSPFRKVINDMGRDPLAQLYMFNAPLEAIKQDAPRLRLVSSMYRLTPGAALQEDYHAVEEHASKEILSIHAVVLLPVRMTTMIFRQYQSVGDLLNLFDAAELAAVQVIDYS
jgi:hypothetical protein